MNSVNSYTNASNGQLIGTIKKLKKQLRELTDNNDHKIFTGKISRLFFNTQKGIIQDDYNEQFHFHFLDCDFENEPGLLLEVTFSKFETNWQKIAYNIRKKDQTVEFMEELIINYKKN